MAVLALLGVLAGSAHAAFNEIISGARPQGMGGAFVAVADDYNALYWNPAGATAVPKSEVGLMHGTRFDLQSGAGLTEDFAGYVSGPLPYGSWGISYYNQALEDILAERYLAFTYGVAYTPATRFGVNLKTVNLSTTPQGNFAPDPALTDQTSVTFDLGFLQYLSPDIRFGFLARNLGGELGVVETESLVRNVRMGLALDLEEYFLDHDRLVLSLDLSSAQDIDDEAGTQILTHVGIEYCPGPLAALRLGVDDGKVTAGLGFRAFDISIDYSFADEEVGNTQILSGTYRFSPFGTVETNHYHHQQPRYHPEQP